jgi:hypothetical protein
MGRERKAARAKPSDEEYAAKARATAERRGRCRSCAGASPPRNRPIDSETAEEAIEPGTRCLCISSCETGGGKMKWEKQFDHAFKVINPNIKAITEGWNADDLERVKQRAEFEYSPPRRHATEAVEIAIVHVQDMKWEEANPEQAEAMKK